MINKTETSRINSFVNLLLFFMLLKYPIKGWLVSSFLVWYNLIVTYNNGTTIASGTYANQNTKPEVKSYAIGRQANPLYV